jgi:hypothetical protein
MSALRRHSLDPSATVRDRPRSGLFAGTPHPLAAAPAALIALTMEVSRIVVTAASAGENREPTVTKVRFVMFYQNDLFAESFFAI